MNLTKYVGCVLGIAALAAPAAAQSEDDEATESTETSEGSDESDVGALESRIEELEARLEASEQLRKARFPVKLTGYADLGFFVTQGDGSGLRRDAGHEIFPDRADIAWVFYGDLLATMVNARGDVADLGETPGVDRLDALDSEGNSTFLVNELNLGINAGLGDRALFVSSINFTPRSGHEFRLGDSFDVDIAQLEWLPFANGNTSVFVGKVDSVVGIEYKGRKAPDRFGITPTLLARYTTGTAVGLKARSKLVGDRLILSAAITNGSFGTEQFHFHDELDANNFKTVSGRAALRVPVGDGRLEVGASGQWGTQDGAPDGSGAMWTGGVDAELETERFALRAQWLRAKAPGDDVSKAYRLDLRQGAYVETNVFLTGIFGLLGRVELRDAEVQQGMERLYITKNWRGTVGARFSFSPRTVLKAEYSYNGEYGPVPSIPDDVVTTSALVAF
jgi:hypothetical protein